jgi:hypothetical protein
MIDDCATGGMLPGPVDPVRCLRQSAQHREAVFPLVSDLGVAGIGDGRGRPPVPFREHLRGQPLREILMLHRIEIPGGAYGGE